MTWNMARNTEKREKCEKHTVVPEIWQEILKNVKNEKCALQDHKYGEKTEKYGK